MQVALESPRAKKQRIIKRVTVLAKKYQCIAISSLYKIRAAQLMELRKKFRNNMEILVVKNKIASMALKEEGLEISERFTDKLKGQSAMIFTNIDPFKLDMMFEKNKVNLQARPGDLATEEIMIPEGNTGIPPGPVLSEFKEAKVPTKIDAGSIWVSKDTTVVRKGESISPKLASLLSRLDVKPIRAGLSAYVVWFEGSILYERDIKLDLEEYRRQIEEVYLNANRIAIEASYPTRETLPFIISKFELKARLLAITAGYMSKDVIIDLLVKCNNEAILLAMTSGYTGRDAISCLLAKGSREASALYNKLEEKGYLRLGEST
ncbi:MAG: 50S ribosomal protein L10 [Candidatus Methylarchaceae archaeon HK01B]|nr:50S ribosomal protein L10 [Candidatus Methylarchaceae archaeon HK01B]